MSNCLRFMRSKWGVLLTNTLVAISTFIMGDFSASYAKQDQENVDEQEIMKYTLDQSICVLVCSVILGAFTLLPSISQLSKNWSEGVSKTGKTIICGISYVLTSIAAVTTTFGISIKGFVLYSDHATTIEDIQPCLEEASLAFLVVSGACIVTGGLVLGEEMLQYYPSPPEFPEVTGGVLLGGEMRQYCPPEELPEYLSEDCPQESA